MKRSVYLDRLEGIPARIASATFPNYSGRKFEITTGTCFNPNENNWQGGSRTYMKLVSRDGKMVTVPECGNPFSGFAPESVEIPPQSILVEHVLFCGKDLGLRFVIRPEEFDTLALPAPVDLTEDEKLALIFTRSRKASYDGKNRKQMAVSDGFDVNGWDFAKDSLISKGLLNKAGAITPAGRNAIGDLREVQNKRIY